VTDGIASRKDDHIRINLAEDVSSQGINPGFERYRFIHKALPEIDLEDVDTSTVLFGRSLKAPIMISCMTGGSAEAGRINRVLAEVAQAQGLAMGLGSGRILLSDPKVLGTFRVRHLAPDVPVIANLGAVQLNYSVTTDDCRRLVNLLEADALALHLNPVQEALQPGGDTRFGGLLRRVDALCRHLEAPVIVKEVGWGLAPDVVRALVDAGVAGVDVAGAGGTSWSQVERYRIADPVRARVAAAFAGWGIPTAEAIAGARAVHPGGLVIGSGGIVDGLDVAKAIALGADIAGMAGPFLRSAAAGAGAANELANELSGVLRVAMFAVGVPTVSGLQGTDRLARLP
jgi:isopentenyl-diphosphate Delta-isomerase